MTINKIDGIHGFFSGQILDDSKTLSDCKIDEKNFIVVMVSKVGSSNIAPPPHIHI